MKTEIQQQLFALRDEKYAQFQAKLLPTLPPERIIGVRTPALRAYAKQLARGPEAAAFLAGLPHAYFDENQLHAFLLGEEQDFAACLARLEEFLPYLDNWATCDQCSPRCFKKHKAQLVPQIQRWLASGQTYTVRFGIGMLLQHFLDEDFAPEYLDWVAALRSEEYYVNMEIAWYFATALAKQPAATLPYLEQQRLALWPHNKAIQKAVESYRIPPEQKAYLRTLKRK